MVPMRLGVHPPFNLDNELLPSLSANMVFPFKRGFVGSWADPSMSESPIQLNSSSGS